MKTQNAAETLSMLAQLRTDGWAVAVHNDYRKDGKPMTFWLFVKDGKAVKGEGDTDEEAIGQVFDEVFPINFTRVTGPSRRQYEMRGDTLWGNFSPSESPPRADHWFPQPSVVQEDILTVARLLEGSAPR